MAKNAENESPSEQETVELNRREFLNYAWGASMVLFMGTAGIVTYLYALPRFKEGEFGGTFTLSVSALPPAGAPPADNAEGRFWLSHTEEGVSALYKVCTHLGCLYKWVDTNDRFECPCHGSKFEKDGEYLEGPAPRSLDQFAMAALDGDGNVLVEWDEATPMPLPPDTASIQVNTGSKVQGESA
jgi:cytochrome b6-f complex iron-sulfur subunit